MLDNKELFFRSLNSQLLQKANTSKSIVETNKKYCIPEDKFNEVFSSENTELIAKLVNTYIVHHYTYQAPRITMLQRYYYGDNDIHYWVNDKAANGRADNRIASGFPKFITNMRVGYRLGKPIQFKWSDNTDPDNEIIDLVKKFNNLNDEEYHEKVMGINLSITGRAYELLYTGESVQDSNGDWSIPDVHLKAIDPATCFVVYDTTVESKPLFAVRYYAYEFNDETVYYADVYTSSKLYHYKMQAANADGKMEYLSDDNLSFDQVPIIEYFNNENRVGDWEQKIDNIDAYDLAMSEMANSQEDFANAKLMINGDMDFEKEPLTKPDGTPILDENGESVFVPKIDTQDRYLFLKPSVIPNANNGNTVINSSAEYLTKNLNEVGWEIYIKRLVADIHKDTNTPDVSDENFGGNNSGIALAYKLFGEDQERSMQESLYTKGIMQRLRLLNYYWSSLKLCDKNIVNKFAIKYLPNVPKNDSEIVNMFNILQQSGSLSDKTLLEFISVITGIDAEAEEERIKQQQQEEGKFGFDGSLQQVDAKELEHARSMLDLDNTTRVQTPSDFIRRMRSEE